MLARHVCCPAADQGFVWAVRRGAVEKKTVLENLDLILLAMDETVDGGCASFTAVASRLPATDGWVAAMAACQRPAVCAR